MCARTLNLMVATCHLAVVDQNSGSVGSQVIPMLSGDATDQTPPDLPSFLFKERIVYLVRNILVDHISLSLSPGQRAVAKSASRPLVWICLQQHACSFTCMYSNDKMFTGSRLHQSKHFVQALYLPRRILSISYCFKDRPAQCFVTAGCLSYCAVATYAIFLHSYFE